MAVGLWIGITVALMIVSVSPRDAIAAALLVSASWAVGSSIWQIAVRDSSPLPLALGTGLAVGGPVLVGVQQATRPWPAGVGLVCLGVAALAALVLSPVRITCSKRHWLVLVPVLVGFAGLGSFFAEHPLRFRGWITYFGDVPFHEALNRSVASLGLTDSSFAAGQQVRYHWLSAGWAGALTDLGGLDSYVSLTRVLYVLAMSTAALLAWSIAREALPTSRWAPLVSSLAMVTVGFIGTGRRNTYNVFLVDISPTHTFAVPLLLLAVLLVLRMGSRGSSRMLGLLVLVGGCLLISRITQAAVLGAGMVALVAFTWLWDRRALRGTVLAFLGLSAAWVFAYVIFLTGGPPNSLSLRMNTEIASLFGLTPLGNGIDGALGAIALACAVLLPCLGNIALLREGGTAARLGVASLTGGIAGVVLCLTTDQAGGGQISFLWAALAISAPGSGAGLALALQRIGPRSAAAAVALLVGCTIGAIGVLVPQFTVATRFGGVMRWMLPTAAMCFVLLVLLTARRPRLVSAALIFAVCAGMAAGATGLAIRWSLLPGSATARTPLSFEPQLVSAVHVLRDKMTEEDIAVTNVGCGAWGEEPPDCGSINFFVSANTGRRVLLEGQDYSAGYSPGSGEAMEPWARERLVASTAFLRFADPQAWCELVDDGVTWAWIDKRIPYANSYEPLATARFENARAIVLQFNVDRAAGICSIT